MVEKWMKWTVLEAMTKAVSKLLQKVIGVASSTFGQTFYATLLVGVVQFFASAAVMKVQKKSIWVNWRNIVGAVSFGIFAVVATVLSFWAFQFEGAEVSVNTFIITLSIVPGAFIDQIFFGHRLSGRHWLGVAVAMLAGYAILDCPSLDEMFKMPTWIWISFGTMLAVAINQGITQANKAIDPMAKNFWGGLVTVIMCIVGLWYFPVKEYPLKLTVLSLLIGVIVIFMWSYNLLSYKEGAYIALKKLVMNGCYLIMVTVAGALFFGETITWSKVAGIILFSSAYVLMEDNSWQAVVSLLRFLPERLRKEE